MEPLRPSADIPQVGTQKDTYGLRFAQFHYTLVDDEIHSLYAQLVTLLFLRFGVHARLSLLACRAYARVLCPASHA